ncbi:MAG: GNAT family N-acetyltransferase [Pseudomonadaceae bacterium]|nr:GNAT family N-acetyltransferase [Pseudomonadaceae bacterium]
MLNIIPYEPRYLSDLKEHFERHWSESGDNDVYFLPFDLNKPSRPRGIDPAACDKDYSEVGWQRWFLVVSDNRVEGHLGIKSNPMEAALHRCELGMGLERQIRNKGIGSRLIVKAIEQATSIKGMAWLDLHVMALNHHARSLYAKYGFVEQATILDRFRIEGHSLDEVLMTLDLSNIESNQL